MICQEETAADRRVRAREAEEVWAPAEAATAKQITRQITSSPWIAEPVEGPAREWAAEWEADRLPAAEVWDSG